MGTQLHSKGSTEVITKNYCENTLSLTFFFSFFNPLLSKLWLRDHKNSLKPRLSTSACNLPGHTERKALRTVAVSLCAQGWVIWRHYSGKQSILTCMNELSGPQGFS